MGYYGIPLTNCVWAPVMLVIPRPGRETRHPLTVRAAAGLSIVLAAILVVPITTAQVDRSSDSDYGVAFRDSFEGHFQRSASKMSRLSAAVPAELYTWAPGEGVMSVARVYAHIARYNYYYLESSLGIPVPAAVDLDSMEDLTEKEAVMSVLRSSIEHVNKYVALLTPADLQRTVRLYGRDVEGWEVLFQLLSHMNEHVGQAVAYARMNEIKPPWSR